MPILRAFLDFPSEAVLIGRMLAGYADLEIDLMNCAKAVQTDLDTTLREMFGQRGNSQRIDIANRLACQAYNELGIGMEFEMAVEAVRHCLRIRNQYAHCTWWNDNSGQLALANLEELATQDVPIINLHGLTVNHVTVEHLESQLAYFEYGDCLLIWVIQEGNDRAGRPAFPNRVFPEAVPQPLVFM